MPCGVWVSSVENSSILLAPSVLLIARRDIGPKEATLVASLDPKTPLMKKANGNGLVRNRMGLFFYEI